MGVLCRSKPTALSKHLGAGRWIENLRGSRRLKLFPLLHCFLFPPDFGREKWVRKEGETGAFSHGRE